MNAFNIAKSFQEKKTRGWEKLYWCVDLHHTIIEGKYNKQNSGAGFYPNAVKVLRNLSGRDDMVLILWTSSYRENLGPILERFKALNINFKYINCNPECQNTELCDFSSKFYFNILIDDKAGFEAEKDWITIENELYKIGEWKKPNLNLEVARQILAEKGIKFNYCVSDNENGFISNVQSKRLIRTNHGLNQNQYLSLDQFISTEDFVNYIIEEERKAFFQEKYEKILNEAGRKIRDDLYKEFVTLDKKGLDFHRELDVTLSLKFNKEKG